jgi:hypothetical protein
MLSVRHLMRAIVENLSHELESLNAYLSVDSAAGTEPAMEGIASGMAHAPFFRTETVVMANEVKQSPHSRGLLRYARSDTLSWERSEAISQCSKHCFVTSLQGA